MNVDLLYKISQLQIIFLSYVDQTKCFYGLDLTNEFPSLRHLYFRYKVQGHELTVALCFSAISRLCSSGLSLFSPPPLSFSPLPSPSPFLPPPSLSLRFGFLCFTVPIVKYGCHTHCHFGSN